MTSRRAFIQQSVVASAGLAMLPAIDIQATPLIAERPGKKTINVFSKNFHWTDYRSMSDMVAELGFDGIDLTVRPEGHVLPERVADDLPKAVEAIKKAGLRCDMIVTAIVNVTTEPMFVGSLAMCGMKKPRANSRTIPYMMAAKGVVGT